MSARGLDAPPSRIIDGLEPCSFGFGFGGGSGGGGGLSLSLSPLSIDGSATGVVANLTSSISGTITYSKVSGSSNITVASGGAVSATASLGGGTNTFIVRAANTAGTAIEKSFTLTGLVPALAANLAYLVSETGAQLVDTSGNYLVGTNSAIDTGLPAKTIAANKGVKFGTFFSVADYQGDASLAALIRSYSNHYVTSNSPSTNWTSATTWSWSYMNSFVSIANADGKTWRYHTIFYPAKEPSWINPTNVTSANWQSLMLAQVQALAAQPFASQWTSIDVINEVCRGDNAGNAANIYGLRLLKNDGSTIPWYAAATANPFTVPGHATMADPGATYVLYAFYLARLYFPHDKLYFCHDQMEQVNLANSGTAAFTRQENANVLALLTALLAAGASIDGVNFQGHLVFSRAFIPTEFRTFIRAVKALGLTFIVGEHDIRSGQSDGNSPANYSTAEYKRVQADMSKQFLDIAIPEINGGELLTWGVSDAYEAWEAGEMPLPYDASFAAKPMLGSIRNSLMGL